MTNYCGRSSRVLATDFVHLQMAFLGLPKLKHNMKHGRLHDKYIHTKSNYFYIYASLTILRTEPDSYGSAMRTCAGAFYISLVSVGSFCSTLL